MHNSYPAPKLSRSIFPVNQRTQYDEEKNQTIHGIFTAPVASYPNTLLLLGSPPIIRGFRSGNLVVLYLPILRVKSITQSAYGDTVN